MTEAHASDFCALTLAAYLLKGARIRVVANLCSEGYICLANSCRDVDDRRLVQCRKCSERHVIREMMEIYLRKRKWQ